MPATMAQLAQIETNPLRKGILLNIIRHAKLMEWLPFENVDSLRTANLRVRTLPAGGAFRAFNGAYTEETGGAHETVWEDVYPFGGDMQFDRVLPKIKNYVVDPRTQLIMLKTTAMSFNWNNYFVNGDHAVDPLGYEGLRKRIAGYPARQTVWGAAAGAAALDPTTNAASARTFIRLWEQAFYRCNNSQVNAILMNELMYYGFAHVLRYSQTVAGSGMLDVTKDSFDRSITTYKGVPFIDVGLLADQATEIITNTENDGTGAIGTSVYFVSFDITDGIMGIQLSPLEAYDPNNGAELATAPATMHRIEWWCGLAGFGSYGCTRLRNVEGANNWTA